MGGRNEPDAFLAADANARSADRKCNPFEVIREGTARIIEDAVVRAFLAGEDMLLICATPATIRRGYRALLEAARAGTINEKRINASLKQIASTRALTQPPPPLDMDKYKILGEEIRDMNETLDYRYPGESTID